MADRPSYFVPFDLDSGGGTEFVVGHSPRGAASGGSAPIYTDPVALGDNVTNPTVGGSQTFGMYFDGSTWDRILGDATDGLLINMGTNNDVINLGTFVVQEDGAALTALELIDNPVQIFDTDVYTAATDSGMMVGVVRNDTLSALAGTDQDIAPLQVNATGALYTAISSSVALDVSAATVTVDGTGTFVVQTEMQAAAALTDTDGNPTTATVGSALMGFDRVNTEWTRIAGLVDGEVVGALNAGFLSFGTDGSNYQVLATDSSGNLQVDLVTAVVDTELPAAAALGDADGNPTTPTVGSALMGFDRVNTEWTRIAGLVDGEVVGALNAGFLQFGTDGSNYQAIAVDSAGQLQVDVLSGGGSPPAPTAPVNDTFTSVSVDVGDANKVDIDGTDDDNRKLSWIDIWSSTAWKGEIFTVDNGTPSTRKGITGGPAMTAVQYIPVHEDYIQVGSTAGIDAFRVTFTNLDDNLTADAHVVFHYAD